MTELVNIERVTDHAPFVIYGETVDTKMPVKVRTFDPWAASLCRRAQQTSRAVQMTYHDWRWGIFVLDKVELHD